MNENKKYLEDLKAELAQYTQKLSAIQTHFKGKAGKDVDKIAHALQDILHEAATAYTRLESASLEEWEPLKKIANKSFKKLRDSFDTFITASSEQVKEYAKSLDDYTDQQLDCAAGYVRQNPFKSILLAAGLGFIIGRILK
ncbi:MAG: DUF883 family protein [Proteobacteria bacterium]|nr:DUF883 family protein [Pseudomonadota bacterium]